MISVLMLTILVSCGLGYRKYSKWKATMEYNQLLFASITEQFWKQCSVNKINGMYNSVEYSTLEESILELTRPYTRADVQNAYRRKAIQLHPDKGGSIKEFIRIAEAKERLLGE